MQAHIPVMCILFYQFTYGCGSEHSYYSSYRYSYNGYLTIELANPKRSTKFDFKFHIQNIGKCNTQHYWEQGSRLKIIDNLIEHFYYVSLISLRHREYGYAETIFHVFVQESKKIFYGRYFYTVWNNHFLAGVFI